MTKSPFVRSLFLGAAASILAVSTASAAGPFQFYSVTPCRIVDTRNAPNAQGTGGPVMPALSQRNFPIAGLCGVPTTAKAAALNVTVVQPTSTGHLSFWPYNTPQPFVSTLNYVGGDLAIANGAIVPLAADANFHVSAFAGISTGSLHLIIDVTGYFQ
ncbi:MAG TPA: hypothetical protein VFF17_14985 [Thermoanaerobaculia bacterium]|nr:hypothetical protein [Thermoanaerobaculia bacterium]